MTAMMRVLRRPSSVSSISIASSVSGQSLRSVARRAAAARAFSDVAQSNREQEQERPAVLTREFIYGSLYAKEAGYFTTQGREVLHAPADPIDFGNLWGAREYRRVVAQLYTAKKEAWLTPVEVFAPYYSHALAHYMLNSPFGQKQLEIYEIGGGSGSNALHILNYLQVSEQVVGQSSHSVANAARRHNRRTHRTYTPRPSTP
jgi:hypothetical protein